MVTLSPVGLNSINIIANQVSLLVTINEKLAKTYCINSSVQPQITLNYTTGNAKFIGETVFVPITAVLAIAIPDNNGNILTRLYTEKFDVAFQNQTGLPRTVTVTSLGRDAFGSNIKCCKVHNYTVNDSITVEIVPAN